MQQRIQSNIYQLARITTAYISHGGGPLPLLEMRATDDVPTKAYHTEMISVLKDLSLDLPKPDLIIVISAHWEEVEVCVTTHPRPTLIYDYYGFPQPAYSIKYPAEGNKAFATSLVKGLKERGVTAHEDSERGFDHGMFIPLSIMYPKADVPCIQMSITSDLSADKHIKLGKALRKAVETATKANSQQKQILILGSGSSFHNMQGFFDNTSDTMRKATRFNNWLQTTMQSKAYSENERSARLVDWSEAPDARYAHPREEHLLPLQVCYGANGKAADKAISLTLLNKPASMFMWHD